MEQGVERDAGFEPGEWGAEAQVDAGAEGDVVRGGAANRSRRTSSAASNVRSSRLAEPSRTMSRAPSGSSTPARVAGALSPRNSDCTGESYRSISSTNAAMRVRSARSWASRSGRWRSTTRALPSRLVVVSLPAMSSSTQKLTSSSSDSGSSPCPPRCTSRLTRSSPGRERRSSTTSAKKPLIASIAESAPAGSGVSENAFMITSVQVRNSPNMRRRDPEELGDHVHRERHRQIAHQLTGLGAVDEIGDMTAGEVGDHRFGGRDPARREPPCHHPTQGRVHGWVLEDQQAGDVLWRSSTERHRDEVAHPARRRVQPSLAQHAHDVLVTADEPAIEHGLVGESRRRSNVGIRRIRIIEDDRVERVVCRHVRNLGTTRSCHPEEVGNITLASIFIYPIKSCRAVELARGDGLGDRAGG